MTNLLKLHEAIAVVLMDCDNKRATSQEIADRINHRKLYMRRDGQDVPAYQIMMRSKLSGQKYSGWFDFIEPNIVQIHI